MRIYILTDLEGVSGIVDFDRQCWPHSPDFRRSQELLTGEVNAAVQGAVEAGAEQVVVCDAHSRGHNILVENLHPQAELIQGSMRPHWLPWIEEGFDAFMQLGIHAMAGTLNAALCHSMELDIVRISLERRRSWGDWYGSGGCWFAGYSHRLCERRPSGCGRDVGIGATNRGSCGET